MKNWQLFFSLKCMCALLWGLTALKFPFTWVRHKGPPILGLIIKISYPIVSLFDMYMYIDMDERIAGKQDRPSLNIEGPVRAP